MNNFFQLNEDVVCEIKSYNSRTRLFQVKTVGNDITGYVYLRFHPVIYRILINALNNHETVTLKYIGERYGKHQFQYILNNTNSPDEEEHDNSDQEQTDDTSQATNQTSEISDIPDENDSEEMRFSLWKEQNELNEAIINALFNALGDKIDTPEKYEVAVSLIDINKQLHVSTSLARNIYNKCSNKYQTQLWNDAILPYCSDFIIRKAWRQADDNEKDNILKRLGIDVTNVPASTNNGQDNSSRSINDMERQAANSAVRELQQQQANLTSQRRVLRNQVEECNQRQATLNKRKRKSSQNAVNRMRNATTEAERNQIQQQSQAEQREFDQQLQQNNAQRQQLQNRERNITEDLRQTQQDITNIQTSAQTQTIGGRGKLKVNLKWNTIDDVDLHIYDPDNNHIYYSSKQHTCQGVLGQLDVDANAGGPFITTPQENIYWDDLAPIGHYKVDVNMYCMRSGSSNVPFTVTIYPEKGEPKTLSRNLTSNGQTIHLIEFDYDENGIHYNN